MKTRNKIAIGLCSFYLLSVTGIALNLHFCSDELSSVNFTHKANYIACEPASNNLLAKQDTCQNHTKPEAKCENQQQTPAKSDAPKRFSVSSFFAPVVAEFIEYLMPGLFFKIQR